MEFNMLLQKRSFPTEIGVYAMLNGISLLVLLIGYKDQGYDNY